MILSYLCSTKSRICILIWFSYAIFFMWNFSKVDIICWSYKTYGAISCYSHAKINGLWNAVQSRSCSYFHLYPKLQGTIMYYFDQITTTWGCNRITDVFVCHMVLAWMDKNIISNVNMVFFPSTPCTFLCNILTDWKKFVQLRDFKRFTWSCSDDAYLFNHALNSLWLNDYLLCIRKFFFSVKIWTSFLHELSIYDPTEIYDYDHDFIRGMLNNEIRNYVYLDSPTTLYQNV